MQKYDVTLGWVGERALIVTVPTLFGPDTARRRAFFAIAAQHPRRNLENLRVLVVRHLPDHGSHNCPGTNVQAVGDGMFQCRECRTMWAGDPRERQAGA